VLGHVDDGSAILPADREPLQQAQADQEKGGGDPDGLIARQQAHPEGGQPHGEHADQEGELAANRVAQTAKDDGPEGAHQKACGERQQSEGEIGVVVQIGEELLADEG
jgi:hypothetical protein